MGITRPKPEEIVVKLRQVEVLTGQCIAFLLQLCIYNQMKNFAFVCLAVATLMNISVAVAGPVDLTGRTCLQQRVLGPVTWDFYGDVAIREYVAGDGRPVRFERIGEGAYQRIQNYDGEISSYWYFFDEGDGVHIRIFASPGMIAEEENRGAPWQRATIPFFAECVPLWQRNEPPVAQ